ncbi:hypothetical protein Acsp06_58240 [Actinomycetospora sp. NBRC 106375]|uniref:MarR family winged helix-turn-helix transcriptional regulator n=1 Tax=Actinomycetospora sp. NBRC 106375 TaxID=3032207 RepID=UPI0024A439FE|nr:MarR family transcriptional regulator [Actinomycetospora sp. NBRC 106375]GLZ49639.1 hypothetical protein Acsp06_58240 [Actinomycetospora sp. NBRC 106375]
MTDHADMPGRMRDLVLALDAYRRAHADVLGLGIGELLTLSDLGRQDAQPVSLLAARLGVAAPAGTALVDRLHAKGLVVRRRHPTDRRSRLVELTPRGRRVAELMDRLFHEDVSTGLDGVPLEHLHELADLLDRVAAALRLRAGDLNDLRRRMVRADSASGDGPAAPGPPPPVVESGEEPTT